MKSLFTREKKLMIAFSRDPLQWYSHCQSCWERDDCIRFSFTKELHLYLKMKSKKKNQKESWKNIVWDSLMRSMSQWHVGLLRIIFSKDPLQWYSHCQSCWERERWLHLLFLYKRITFIYRNEKQEEKSQKKSCMRQSYEILSQESHSTCIDV